MAVIRATGASAFEIIVLRLETGDVAADLEPVLADYLTARRNFSEWTLCRPVYLSRPNGGQRGGGGRSERGVSP